VFFEFCKCQILNWFSKNHQILYYVLLASQQYRLVFKYFYFYKKYCQIWLNHQMDHCPFWVHHKTEKEENIASNNIATKSTSNIMDPTSNNTLSYRSSNDESIHTMQTKPHSNSVVEHSSNQPSQYVLSHTSC